MILNKALQYIKNAKGGASLENFLEDHEPVGGVLWGQLNVSGLAYLDAEGKTRLTSDGEAELAFRS